MKLDGKRVLIIYPDSDYINLFALEGADVSTIWSPEEVQYSMVAEYDLVCFTGGSDLNPAIYGQQNIGSMGISDVRDTMEKRLFMACIQYNIPMVGICRGAQLLCVMNGGSLIQDVNNHESSHTIHTIGGEEYIASSSHHQMMVPKETSHILLGYALGLSTKYISDDIALHDDLPVVMNEGHEYVAEPEVVLWPDSRCLGHQPHPEWMGEQSVYRAYFIYTVTKLLEL